MVKAKEKEKREKISRVILILQSTKCTISFLWLTLIITDKVR